MDKDELMIREWLWEVGLCGLPKQQALYCFRAIWCGEEFSFAEDQSNLPATYLLISYLQPRGERGMIRDAWVSKALVEIEEVYTHILANLQVDNKRSRSQISPGIWFDKLGKFMVDEHQSKWAAHCQLQFSIFPTCILVPEPSTEYTISDLERPLLGVEAFDPGLTHLVDCQQCGEEIVRLWQQFFASTAQNNEQLAYQSADIIKAATNKTLEITDITDIAFVQAQPGNGLCPLCLATQPE